MAWKPSEEGEAFWQGQRMAVLARSGGWCESKIVRCNATFGDNGERMDASHIIPLGMGRDRRNPDDPLNDISNLEALCRRCHLLAEAARLKANAAEKGV